MIPAFDVTLVVLAKSPRPGRVKTRLCPPCTPTQAATIAEAALADTLETVGATPARRHVLVLDGPVGPWLPGSFEVIPQVDGGLGRRLAAAIGVTTGPVFLVGMDTPQLTVELLTGALQRLAGPGVDAVLGHTEDGGWWGLGLVGACPTAFDGVPMGSTGTGVAQLAQLRRLGLATVLLPELRDVDHFSDAVPVATLVPGSRFARAVATTDLSAGWTARAS